ncbi:MAG: hypothetical protein IKY91_05590 [Akkermansia sp.]|nr:hypothetical protein [Akkermansia sp.]
MKAKVLKSFRDRHTGEIYKVGKTLTVSRERFEEILTVGPLVEEVKAKKKTED